MAENKSFIETLIERLEEYVTTNYELIKLKALNRSTDVASTVIVRLIVLVFLLFFLVFISIGAAQWLGDIVGKSYYGYFIVAGFYAIVALFVRYIIRKSTKRKVADFLIKHIMN